MNKDATEQQTATRNVSDTFFLKCGWLENVVQKGSFVQLDGWLPKAMDN